MKIGIRLLLFKISLFVIPIFILFEILFRLGFSPIVTNSAFFDFKMLELQKHHIKKVQLMAIGSSIALYELNSKVIIQNLDVSYYNFASWNLQIADMRILLKTFIKEYSPNYVLICSSFADFISPQNDSYLDYLNTNIFVRDKFPEYFYFNNYSSLHQIIRKKYKAYPINLDQWGGASLTIQRKDINADKWNEHDIFPTKFTPHEYNELDSLASMLHARNINLIFAQAPVKASYANTPSANQVLESHFDKCKSIVETEGGKYLNYYNTSVFKDSLFFDQFHLQRQGAVILTNLIVADLKKIIR